MQNLETVKTLVAKHPGVIRKEILDREINGLAESNAIIKHRGKILIDSDRYFDWLTTPMQV